MSSFPVCSFYIFVLLNKQDHHQHVGTLMFQRFSLAVEEPFAWIAVLPMWSVHVGYC